MPLRPSNERMITLAKKWREGTITDEERAEFDQWYDDFDDTHLFEVSGDDEDTLQNRIYERIRQTQFVSVRRSKRLQLWKSLSGAAAVTFFLLAGVWFLQKKQPAMHISKTPAVDYAPGANKAVLTLSGGEKIELAGAAAGKLAEQPHAKIFKNAAGTVVYGKTNPAAGDAAAYNTIATERGGQYTIILSDGTKVLLNSQSSLVYPTIFSGKVRRVELTGEAYFEVAKDKHHPFIVKTATQEVKVLGTHFNISSYRDEPAVKTTLIEGRVEVSDTANHQFNLLEPGQQSECKDHKISVEIADVAEAIAWTKGDFIFRNEDLESIMRKISRWYNVDVIYSDSAARGLIVDAEVSRSKNLSSILRVLESTGKVRFETEDRRIKVM